MLAERYLALGLSLTALAFLLAVPLVAISLNRIHAYEKEYLEGLDQESLMALLGKEMSYQSKFSTAMVAKILDRRFPTWRTGGSAALD